MERSMKKRSRTVETITIVRRKSRINMMIVEF